MVDALTSGDLRILAASECAWAESRMTTYREDAAPVPDPIRRCHGLASAVLAFLPGMGAASSDGSAATADKAVNDLRNARECIYVIGVILQTLNADLDGTPLSAQSLAEPARPGKGSDVGASTANAPRAGANPSPATVSQVAVAGAADGPRHSTPLAGQWPASGLYHGLVLIDATGARRLFAEPIRGQFVVQNVSADGLPPGEPWSTMSDRWRADAWTQAAPLTIAPALRRYDDATGKAKAKSDAADRTLALPGMGNVTAVGALTNPLAPVRKTIGDYMPGGVQFQTWTAALSKAAGQQIEETRVRELFASWQAANACDEKPNPAAAFWQHARSVIG